MVFSVVQATDAMRTTRRLPAIGPVGRALDYRSIPDPFRLRREAIGLESAKEASQQIIFDWCERAHDCLSFLSATDPSRIWIWQEQVLPILLASDFLKRCRDQPRGHAGDYLTIQMMDEGVPRSKDRFGRAIDAWIMDQPVCKAVRNRGARVQRFLQRVRAGFRNEPISIASLGCGPAIEVFNLDFASSVHFTLVDIDQQALDHVGRKAVDTGIANRVKTVKADATTMVDGNKLADGYGCFYGLDSINYLSDQMVVRLLDSIYSKLLPFGSLLLGNFRRGHPNAALFEHALNWPLTLRSEPELLCLVKKSKFANSAMTVASEPEGVQLFIECKKLRA